MLSRICFRNMSTISGAIYKEITCDRTKKDIYRIRINNCDEEHPHEHINKAFAYLAHDSNMWIPNAIKHLKCAEFMLNIYKLSDDDKKMFKEVIKSGYDQAHGVVTLPSYRVIMMNGSF
jgi:hypothetical protein